MLAGDRTKTPRSAVLVLGFQDESAAKNFGRVVQQYLFRTDGSTTVVPQNAIGLIEFEKLLVSCTETRCLSFIVKRREVQSGRHFWVLLMSSDPASNPNN